MTRREAQTLRRLKEKRDRPVSDGPDPITRTRCRRMFGLSVKATVLGMAADGYSSTTIAAILRVSSYRLRGWCRDWGRPDVYIYSPQKRAAASRKAWEDRSVRSFSLTGGGYAGKSI